MPFGVAVLQAAGLVAAFAKLLDRVVREDAIRTAAIGDDVDLLGQVAELSA